MMYKSFYIASRLSWLYIVWYSILAIHRKNNSYCLHAEQRYEVAVSDAFELLNYSLKRNYFIMHLT